MIRLRLFGSAGLTRGDGTEVRSVLAQPKRLALLAYLAIGTPRGFHRRDRLLALFWPEVDDGHARNSLGQSLHFLRRALGAEALPSRGADEVGIDPERLRVDVLEFEALAQAGDGVGALERFGGGLLEGLHVSELPDVERWLDQERARLGHLAWDTAIRTAQEVADAGDLEGAVALAHRAASIRPVNDASARLLMTLLHRSGDRTGALDVFERLDRELRQEYDAEPDEETRALSDEIRRSTEAVPEATSRPQPESPTEQAPAEALPSSMVRKEEAPRTPAVAKGRAAGRWLLGAVAALVLVGAIYTVLSRMTPTGADGRIPRVVLTDFHDATDEGLGQVVTEALRIDLERSRVLDLMGATEVAPALARLGADPGAGLTAELGRDIARREGIGAVIDGGVAVAGGGYILTATLRDAKTGRPLKAFRINAEGPDDLIGAIDRLSHAIRRESGEPLRTLRPEEPLARVTTASLAALILYSEGVKAFNLENDRARAARLQEQAVRLDPEFAMAWWALSRALQGSGDAARRAEVLTRAFENRERMPLVERYLVEAQYDQAVAGGGPATIAAYEAVLLIDPDNGRALNNLGLQYRYVDDLDRAEEVLRRAVAGPGRTSSAYLNLFFTELSRDRGDEAAVVLLDMVAAYPDYAVPVGWSFGLAFTRGDLAAAAEHARRWSDDPAQPAVRRAVGMGFLAMLAEWSGRLDEARALNLSAESMAAADGPKLAWARRTTTALEEVLVGDPQWGRDHILAGLDRALASLGGGSRGDYQPTALALAYAGDAQNADRVLRAWLAAIPADPAHPANPELPAAIGRTALYIRTMVGAAADTTDVLQRLPTKTRCEDACWAFTKARLHDARGERGAAVAAYERVRRGGYTNWGLNIGERLYAMMRLGPLYEELGDTAKAIEAYRRVTGRWSDADTRGQVTVRRFRERIAALGG